VSELDRALAIRRLARVSRPNDQLCIFMHYELLFFDRKYGLKAQALENKTARDVSRAFLSES
jgi:hypothetical protein